MPDTTDNTNVQPDFLLCEDGVIRHRHDCCRLEDGRVFPQALCVETHDGEMWLLEECVQLCTSGKYAVQEDTVLTFDGRTELRVDCVLLDGAWARSDSDDIVQLENGDYWWSSEAVEIHGDYYHPDDTSCCDRCGESMLHDDAHTLTNGDCCCEGCFECNTCRCDSCDNYCWDDDCDYDSDSETTTCTRCHRRANPPPPQLIVGYCDRTANRLPSESTDKILYGIELEVESRNGNSHNGAEFVRKHLPVTYCVLKTDGSLSSGGFEIVTRPDSVAVHKRMWNGLLRAKPFSVLSSWTNGRCGMHVHVSRRGLTPLQLGKMLCFLNEPANESLVVKIAGRRASRWAMIAKKKVTDVWSPNASCDRYSALNLCNEKTVEFRIFKGTLNADAFFKNLEFCQALVAFTAPCSRSLADATSATRFIEWLPYKEYPNLYAWMVRRGFITNDRRPKRKAG